MLIEIGYELGFSCHGPTPMLLTLNVHPSRAGDLLAPDFIQADPPVPMHSYRDAFDNVCTRVTAPAGEVLFHSRARVRDHGRPDPVVPDAVQHPVEELPDETLIFLLASRYCEVDLLLQTAWDRFGGLTGSGWEKVMAICEFVHGHIQFGYEHAHPGKTAFQAYTDRRGVCRDYAHLAVTLCRAMNIPARYCSGYVSDIGQPPPYASMDFAGWFEAFVGGAWHVFDPRNLTPRVGRVLMARGRDAADAALTTVFGFNTLTRFVVHTHEVSG